MNQINLRSECKFPPSFWQHVTDGKLTDCVIRTRDGELKVHRIVLASASEFLHVRKQLFLITWLSLIQFIHLKKYFTSKEQPTVVNTKCSLDVVTLIIKLIYCHQINVNAAQSIEILRLSRLIGLPIDLEDLNEVGNDSMLEEPALLRNQQNLSEPDPDPESFEDIEEVQPISSVSRLSVDFGIVFNSTEVSQNFGYDEEESVAPVLAKSLQQHRKKKLRQRGSRIRFSLGLGPQFRCQYCPNPTQFYFKQGCNIHESICNFNPQSHEPFTCDKCRANFSLKGHLINHYSLQGQAHLNSDLNLKISIFNLWFRGSN